jgi:thioredoxin reductase (NADPH)
VVVLRRRGDVRGGRRPVRRAAPLRAVGDTRPILLGVADDPALLRLLESDLRRRYDHSHRVVTTASPDEAQAILRTARVRNDRVAMVLCDERIASANAVELLGRARALHPEARTVLLTRYADVEQAIAAINTGNVDYYVLEPWQPAEEKLYPVLDDLLGAWARDAIPAFTGVRVVGHRWSPDSHQVRHFLARYQVPYQWLDVETEPEALRVLDATGNNAQATGAVLPLVVLPDGTVLEHPTPGDLAAALGLTHTPTTPSYDVVIVGAGPAGLAAAVYAASEGLRAVVVDREGPGGQAGLSARIENYLGFPSGISGAELARRALTQARRFGADFVAPVCAEALERNDPYRVVHLSDGARLSAEAMVLACGVAYRRLEVPGAEELTNNGIYYGASLADAPFCAGEHVAIVGGGNSAGQAALSFAPYAKSVTLLVLDDSLGRGMSAYLVERIEQHPGIAVRTCTEVVECWGAGGRLSGVAVRDNRTGAVERLEVTLLFVFIGAQPATEWLGDVVAKDDHGFLLTGTDLGDRGVPTASGGKRDVLTLETSVPGVFAAGDARHGSLKRVASAVGEGSTAVALVHRYLDR